MAEIASGDGEYTILDSDGRAIFHFRLPTGVQYEGRGIQAGDTRIVPVRGPAVVIEPADEIAVLRGRGAA